jgi:hypothetical protein
MPESPVGLPSWEGLVRSYNVVEVDEDFLE